MAKTEARRSSARIPAAVQAAARAADDKQAHDITLLDLRKAGGFTDWFVVCTGTNARQVRAIADAVETALRTRGERPAHVEGYDRSAWVLLDYFDFVVHVFTPETRLFYDLERLWADAVVHRFDPHADIAPELELETPTSATSRATATHTGGTVATRAAAAVRARAAEKRAARPRAGEAAPRARKTTAPRASAAPKAAGAPRTSATATRPRAAATRTAAGKVASKPASKPAGKATSKAPGSKAASGRTSRASSGPRKTTKR